MSQQRITALKKQIASFEKEGFMAIGRPDLAPYLIKIPFDWGADPYQDRNWRFQLNTLRYLGIYRDAFNLTLEQHYLTTLLDTIQDWAFFSAQFENDYAWNDMAAGIRAEQIGHVLDVLKKHQQPIPGWLDALVLLHVKNLSVPGFIKTNHNHGMYVIHGLRILSKHVDENIRAEILQVTRRAIICLFQSQFDEFYVHKEHSPHYHHLITASLERHLKTGLYEDVEFLKTCYLGARAQQEYFYLPDGREIPFGDTDGKLIDINAQFSKQSDWQVFNKSGYFIAKNTNGSYLASTNSYNSNVHKHADNLSLIFGYQGQDILADPGKYKYENNEIRRKILSSISHSVVNNPQRPWQLKDIVMPIELFKEDRHDHYFKVEGQLKICSPRVPSTFFRKLTVTWGRQILYHEQGFLVVIDSINKSSPQLVTRFTLDPSQCAAVIRDDNINIYEGHHFLFRAFNQLDDGILSPAKIQLNKNIPVSKGYGRYELTQQLEIKMRSKKTISIFILDRSVPLSFILKFIKESIVLNS